MLSVNVSKRCLAIHWILQPSGNWPTQYFDAASPNFHTINFPSQFWRSNLNKIFEMQTSEFCFYGRVVVRNNFNTIMASFSHSNHINILLVNIELQFQNSSISMINKISTEVEAVQCVGGRACSSIQIAKYLISRQAYNNGCLRLKRWLFKRRESRLLYIRCKFIGQGLNRGKYECIHAMCVRDVHLLQQFYEMMKITYTETGNQVHRPS